MSRLHQIYKIIKFNKPTTIVEVGTYSGVSAIHLITWACKFAPKGTTVKYYGFDLFEDSTQENDDLEFNAKSNHASMCQVEYTIRKYIIDNGLNCDFDLIKGNSKDTVTQDGPWKTADLAFIDGGHSIETITSDYEALKNCKAIIFDDYYVKDADGKCPDITKVGCNFLSKIVPSAAILPVGDPVKGGGIVQLVLTPITANPYPVQFEVKTKNCVDDGVIQENIRYATAEPRKFVPICKQHNARALIVAAGPSMYDDIEEIRKLSNSHEHFVFCVKSSYKPLLDAGVNVHGVVLLDPRDHVKNFLDPIRDDIFYYMATMCHPSTMDMFDKAKNLYLWHALVGAGEDKLIKDLIEIENRPISNELIRGGSTAAMRSMFIAHILGFRQMTLYGFDSCFWEPQDMNHKDSMGQPYFWNVTVNGKSFLTSLQMYSQAQEFGKLLEGLQQVRSFDIDVKGRGIIKHIFDTNPQKALTFESFVNA